MAKTSDGALVTHRGDCGCVREAFHIVDDLGELFGLAFDQKTAVNLKKRLEGKHAGVLLKISKRNIFTIARHVDAEGRFV